MEQIVSNYLEYLNIPISTSYCEKRIRSHPEYPSLLSIADTLKRLGIPYEAARVNTTNLFELEYPFLLQPNEGSSELVLVKNKEDLEQIKWEDEQSPNIVLQAEPVESVKDEKNSKYRSRELSNRNLQNVLITAVTGLILLPLFQLESGTLILLHILATVGAVLGYLLFAKDLGITYEPVEQFCNSGKNNNCDIILQSEEARILGYLTFSDTVGIYFSGQLIILGMLLPFVEGRDSFMLVLTLLGSLALPVVAYSLYYQWHNANVWCRLCLAVDVVLVAQAALFGYNYYNNLISIDEVTPFPLLLALFIFGAIGTSLVLLKNKLKDAKDLVRVEVEYNRLKYTPSVFSFLLTQDEKVDTALFDKELLLGNPKAPVRITMASNLYCGPCGLQHKELSRLIETFPEKICANIRLFRGSNGSGRLLDPNYYLLGYWLEHIQGASDESAQTEELLQDWYSTMNLDTFKEQYSLDVETKKETKELEAQHYQWKEKVQISKTPTFFINGYPLPKQYKLKDIKDLMPGLANRFVSKRESAMPGVN